MCCTFSVENPCSSNPCDENACCDDALGDFSCDCNTGYTGNGVTCTGDITWSFCPVHHLILPNSPSRAQTKVQLAILLQTLMNVQQLFAHTLIWDVWMPKGPMHVVVSKVICGMAQTVLVSSEEVSHWQFWFVYCFVTVWLLTRRFYTGFMLFSLTSVLEVVFLFRVHYICTMNPFFPVEDVCSEENIDCGGGCCIDTLGVASCKCADGFDLSATGICEGEFWTWNPSKEQQLSTWPHTDETCHQLGDRVTKGGSRFIEKYVTSHWHEMRLSASLDSH